MNFSKFMKPLLAFLLFQFLIIEINASNAIFSIDTGETTIERVRTATKNNTKIIIGGSYDGIVIATTFDGNILWQTATGNGTLINDIWCADITKDEVDEILVANADGYIYCLDIDGNIKWKFSAYESVHKTPMYTVCALRTKSDSYVVCSDYSTNIYYLDTTGKLKLTVPSEKYSKQSPWGSNSPKKNRSTAMFLRPIPQKDNTDLLFLHATCNHMQVKGEFHIMKPLSTTSQCYSNFLHLTGDIRVTDADGDGHYDVLAGASALDSHYFERIVFNDTYTKVKQIAYKINKVGTNSYRVTQPFVLRTASGSINYAALSSDQIAVYANNNKSYDQITDNDVKTENNMTSQVFSKYTYNDIWDCGDGKLLLASSQDGGSCIHIIDLKNNSWEADYKTLVPIGKITTLKNNLRHQRDLLSMFKKPDWQREPVMVTGFEGSDLNIASKISGSKSLTLLKDVWFQTLQNPSWRSPLYNNSPYKDKLDARYKYTRTEDNAVDFFSGELKKSKSGIQFWGGHGNDPLFWSLNTMKRIIKYGNDNKKATILTFPEMNQFDNDFTFIMNNHIYPLMDYMADNNSKIAFRAKNVFWMGQVYRDTWADVLNGKYAKITIPIMEETTDKTQDMSLASRMGVWYAGSIDNWGVRCSRDDVSYDRLKQYSSQKLSNHFLRKTIYALASGASYIHNSYPDTQNNTEYEYHSQFVLELLAKEALYVPKREELLSISPVHISMIDPQESFINEADNNKWTTFFDKDKEDANPAVFSHMNGSWPAATLTPWDYSTYATGCTDRRYNPIPTCPNGMVLITPVQEGNYAKTNQPRGKMIDHLNPIYKDIMKEYITDGVNYLDADGNGTYPANTYYQNVVTAIEEGAKKLPVNVSGKNVGWVVAAMDSKHLRLTLVDGSFLNPMDRTVTVSFNNLNVASMVDILDGTQYSTNGSSSVQVTVPCGMFRFIDIILSDPCTGVATTMSKEISSLSQNRPNPVTDTTIIDYKIPLLTKDAVINIYSPNGTLVKSCALDETKSIGCVELNSSDFHKGVYYYSLLCDGQLLSTKRMLMSK